MQVFVPFTAPALARIPLLPLTCPAEPGGAGETVDPLIREGMFLTSRQAAALAAAASQDGRGGGTVRSYTLRASTRPTPQGVFAGVTAAFFSGSGKDGLTMGGTHRARSVPDPGWLATVADHIVEDPDVLPLLTLSANNLTVQRGERLEHERPAEPGGTGVRRATVRATDATLLIMQACAGGASWGEVLDAVTCAWPRASEAPIRAMVLQLVGHGFLLTDLLGEGGSDDPLGHLLAKLPGSALREDVELLRRHLAGADTHPPGAPQRLTMLAAAQDIADRLCRQERPFRVDVAVDAHLVLPARLAREAADAAGVLWRVGAAADPLAGFHDRFTNRYGRHRFVPLLDAIDPVIGVGTDMTETPPDMTPTPTRVLASLIAAAKHCAEVELDAATVEALAKANGGEAAQPPRTAEIYVRVFADSPQDAAAGRLRLAVAPGGGTQEARSSSGRFASLLPELRTMDDEDGDAVVAELVVRSRTPSGAMLAPPTGFAAHRIPLGVPVRPGDLKLDDLLLVSDGRRLLLWSARLGQRVIPVLFSRLSSRLLPPIAQFLRLLGQHECRPWRAWSWGPLAALPFQPRVRYRSTILAPARWTFPPTVTGAAEADWDAALDTWRMTTAPAPPDVVVVTDHDRALPVDLRRADDRALLHRYVKRGATAVTEQPGGPGAVQGVVVGPAGPHALELVVSLARAQTPPPSPLPPADVAARRPGEGLHLPGGHWLSLVIRTPETCQDTVLSRLAAACDGVDGRWFWLRYADQTGPHLRVRFHGHPAHLSGRILPMMGDLIDQLIRDRLASGLSVEPYEQEVERYGGSPEAMEAAEGVFAADSQLVLATLTATPDHDQRTIIAALSAATIIRILANGDRRALAGHHVDRGARRKMAELRPLTRVAAGLTPAESVMAPYTGSAWAVREKALAAYRGVLRPEQHVSCASSLVHMHVNRILGVAVPEPLVRALAVDLLFLGAA